MDPTVEQATQFCLILQAGCPSSEAIKYFVESCDPAELGKTLARWKRSRTVQAAWTKIHGKAWVDMSLEEKMRTGLDMTYAGLAFVLYNNNYTEAGPAEKSKLDTARTAIEAKLAGTAGSQDPMSRFLADLQAGKFAAITAPAKPN